MYILPNSDYIFPNLDYLVHVWDVFQVLREKLLIINGQMSPTWTKPGHQYILKMSTVGSEKYNIHSAQVWKDALYLLKLQFSSVIPINSCRIGVSVCIRYQFFQADFFGISKNVKISTYMISIFYQSKNTVKVRSL